MDLMRIKWSLVLGILLVGEHADAGFDLNAPDNLVFTGFRVSYDKTLGVGVGVHASYWDLSVEELFDDLLLLPSSTLGLVWYKGLSRQYIGLQTGSFGRRGVGAGVSGGIFAQQGKQGSFTGKYFELWGATVLGASIRRFIKWDQVVREAPLEWSLFATYPVLWDGQLRE